MYSSPTVVVAYLALFVTVGGGFLLVNLLVGRLLRPKSPNAEKLAVYECGEPTIGSSFVQFDLRFYVVALLFIIFDVEVAFFFPWATVYGKATHLMDPNLQVVESAGEPIAGSGQAARLRLTAAAAAVERQLGVPNPRVPSPTASQAENTSQVRETARTLALTSIYDILVFFAVLMVGFAYVWRRGDLDWVRAIGQDRQAALIPPSDRGPSDRGPGDGGPGDGGGPAERAHEPVLAG